MAEAKKVRNQNLLFIRTLNEVIATELRRAYSPFFTLDSKEYEAHIYPCANGLIRIDLKPVK